MVQQQNCIAEQFRQDRNHGQSVNAHSYCAAAPAVSPPPEPTGGVLAFPHNATKIFPLKQNSLSLAFHATRLQPHSPRIWRRLRRIFAKLMKERKEALRKFLRMNEIDKEVVVQPKVQRLRENLVEKEKTRRKFTEKPPPDLNYAAWFLGVVPALRRAPNNAALRCVGG
jgi:hypothetical protein